MKDAISLGTNYASIPVEGDLLTDALPSFEKGEWPRALFGNAYEVELYRREGVIDKQKLFKDWAPWVRENEVFIEKSIANSLKVKQLHGLHDNYKSIVVVRRPEGVIRGIRKRSKPGLKASKFLQSSEYPIDFLLNQWLYIYKALLEDCDGDNNVIFVNYEDFIENPALVLTHIKKHLGESCDGLSFSERSIINNNQRLEILASKTASELINPYFQGVDVALTDKVENLYRELQEKVLYER
ncbi:sulfotransferase [Kangiella sp. M94]